MTLTVLPPAGPAGIQMIPSDDLVAGHVLLWVDGTERRIDHIAVEDRGPIFDPERYPARRVAVGMDGWELTLMPDQDVPVRVPTELYKVDAYRVDAPNEPHMRIDFAAETVEMAKVIARRLLFLVGAGWGDIVTADGTDIDVVEVPR